MACKTLYLVRHGEATHNEAIKKYGKQIVLQETFFDPELTPLGRSQAAQTRDALGQTAIENELCVVSPLSRALQTSYIIFPTLPKICLEVVREMIGEHPCDRRRSQTELQALYPDLTFCLDGDEDVLYSPAREPASEVANRARRFLKWLRDQPQRTVAVVTHDHFLEGLWGVLREMEQRGECTGTAGVNKEHFSNAECRRVEVTLSS
ncbi:putative Histidine phosphatase superfamily; clade-1 [Paratrimastix pyriformis]|uniref:Histidine phosphatase superfamily n=1 Tax=Paratrimastix pyriformis TaxID=342808 RepID=A0ABQ8UAJ8_9EUKA|nr:putative Histidine phosphatase superfamily; clade-1 [Paratrimastix pyriformis]